MEKRNLEIFNQVSQGLAEGIDKNKAFALAGLMSDTSLDVERVFREHEYDLSSFPLKFLKMYTVNEKELGELIEVLKEYKTLDLKEVANAMMDPIIFKTTFLARVKFCMDNNIEYRDENGLFVPWLFSTEAFAMKTMEATNKGNDVKTVQELMNEGQEIVVKQDAVDKLGYLDQDDMKKYETITEALVDLNLNTPEEDPLHDVLNGVVANLLDRESANHANLISALSRKEYKFMTLGELVTDYAFQGLEIPGSLQGSLASMIMDAMEMKEEKEKVVGGR